MSDYQLMLDYSGASKATTKPRDLDLDGLEKTMKKAAAAARLQDHLKEEVWPMIFRGLNNSSFIERIYEAKPNFVVIYINATYPNARHKMCFVVDLERIDGAHSDTAGKFVIEIAIKKIRVAYRDTTISEFEPMVGSYIWSDIF